LQLWVATAVELLWSADLGTMGILARSLRSSSQKTLAGHIFPERTDFEAGLLPLQRHVIEAMIHQLMPRGKGNFQPSTQEAAARVASQLLEHWVHCTVYPKHKQQIIKDVLDLYNEFNVMVRTRQERRTETWKQQKMEPYVARISNSMFDISTKKEDFIKKQETFYGAKMSQVESDFLEDQRSERKMYCTSFVDKRWEAGAERRDKEERAMAKMKAKEEDRLKSVETKVTLDEEDNEEDMQEDVDYEVDSEVEENEDDKSKRKVRAFGSVETKKVG
jgi:hypothetical protein